MFYIVTTGEGRNILSYLAKKFDVVGAHADASSGSSKPASAPKETINSR